MIEYAWKKLKFICDLFTQALLEINKTSEITIPVLFKISEDYRFYKIIMQ